MKGGGGGLTSVCARGIGLAAFFAFMTVCEMGGRKAVRRKLEAVFWGTLKSNYVLWPAVQLINFRLMPLALQIVGFAF